MCRNLTNASINHKQEKLERDLVSSFIFQKFNQETWVLCSRYVPPRRFELGLLQLLLQLGLVASRPTSFRLCLVASKARTRTSLHLCRTSLQLCHVASRTRTALQLDLEVLEVQLVLLSLLVVAVNEQLHENHRSYDRARRAACWPAIEP